MRAHRQPSHLFVKLNNCADGLEFSVTLATSGRGARLRQERGCEEFHSNPLWYQRLEGGQKRDNPRYDEGIARVQLTSMSFVRHPDQQHRGIIRGRVATAYKSSL